VENWNPIETFIFSLKGTFTPIFYYITINIILFLTIYIYKYNGK